MSALPTWKKFTFAAIIVALFVLSGEVVLATALYHNKSRHPLAWIHVTRLAVNKVRMVRAEYRRREVLKDLGHLPRDFWDLLYGDPGRRLLSEFQASYAAQFAALAEECRRADAKLRVLYLPSVEFWGNGRIEAVNVAFFDSLSRAHGVEFLNATPEFRKLPEVASTFLPEDAHLSRLGHQVTANFLAGALEGDRHRSSVHHGSRPRLLGDLPGGLRELRELGKYERPYWLLTNPQGFRNPFPVEFPKGRQRILLLGDSFTFGPFLPEQDTYSGFLNRMSKDREFLNAGVEGYTIADEAALFAERARFSEPDLVVLQVLDNDIPGFFSFHRNEMRRRGGQPVKATEAEREFVKMLAARKGS